MSEPFITPIDLGWREHVRGREQRQLARERNMRKEHFFAIETINGYFQKDWANFNVYDTLEELQEAHKLGAMVQKKVYEYRNGERECIGGVWDARWNLRTNA